MSATEWGEVAMSRRATRWRPGSDREPRGQQDGAKPAVGRTTRQLWPEPCQPNRLRLNFETQELEARLADVHAGLEALRAPGDKLLAAALQNIEFAREALELRRRLDGHARQ